MKQILFFTFSLLILVNCKAQDTPKFNKDSLWTYSFGIEAIQESTLDSNSILYYPKLEKRFLNGEDLDKVTAGVFVIGSTKAYEKLSYKNYEIIIDSIVDSNTKQQFALSNEISKRMLKEYPLDLTALFYLVLNYTELNQMELKETYFNQLKVILNGIYEYGNGTINYPFLQLHPHDDEIISIIFGGTVKQNTNLLDYEIACESEKFKIKRTVKINEVVYINENGKSEKLYFYINHLMNF